MNALATALARTRSELDRLGARWAMIGGLALAVRAEPRQTRDVGVVLAVADDAAAERIVRELVASGFRHVEDGVLEQTAVARLATVRLQAPLPEPEALPVSVDLLPPRPRGAAHRRVPRPGRWQLVRASAPSGSPLEPPTEIGRLCLLSAAAAER